MDKLEPEDEASHSHCLLVPEFATCYDCGEQFHVETEMLNNGCTMIIPASPDKKEFN